MSQTSPTTMAARKPKDMSAPKTLSRIESSMRYLLPISALGGLLVEHAGDGVGHIGRQRASRRLQSVTAWDTGGPGGRDPAEA